MLLLMFVSLYTSRVNLNALGVVDFGIYSIVGGLVSMFYIISNALTGSINRYLAFEIGRGNQARLNKIFSASKGFQNILVLIVLLLAETIGLWFLNNKLVIPPERLAAANWVYQFSTLSFCLDLLVIPYTADIIAHEQMTAFAYISIITAIGKLIVAWTITIAPIDQLIWYGALILINSTIIRAIYIVYCKRHFSECRSKFQIDGAIWKEMFGFAGWTFIGTVAAILRDQGGNILINIFAGPTANTARGIANQVNNAVSGFADNFQTALKPQITKSYATGNLEYLNNLIFQGSRFSFYILFILALPISCNTHYIIGIWLGQIPNLSVIFVQLTLVQSLIETLSGPLITAMLATGQIRNFQIIVGGLNLLNLPISYAALKFGYSPEVVIVVAISIALCCAMTRVILLRKMINLSVRKFAVKVFANVGVVSILSAIFPITLTQYMPESFSTFIIVSAVSVSCATTIILFVGCSQDERLMIFSSIRRLINKFKSNKTQ